MKPHAIVTHLGCAGHLCVANHCQYRRHTQIDGPCGSFRVSTVGDYRPPYGNGKREVIGAGADSLFETMVFATTRRQEPGNEGCGCRAIKSLDALHTVRYRTAGEAHRGHEAVVANYAFDAMRKRRKP